MKPDRKYSVEIFLKILMFCMIQDNIFAIIVFIKTLITLEAP